METENIFLCEFLLRNNNRVHGIKGNRLKILTIGKSRHFVPNFIKISCQKKLKRFIFTWSCSFYQDVTFYARLFKMGNFLRDCITYHRHHIIITISLSPYHYHHITIKHLLDKSESINENSMLPWSIFGDGEAGA